MKAYLISREHANAMPNILAHGDYRWAQKAPVTLMLKCPPSYAIGKNVRVFSNGINGGIEVVK